MNLRRAVLLLASLAIFVSAPAQNPADLRLNTIVLDPGHGGKDPGCVSQDKRTQEKTLTLAISKKLAEKIRKKYPEMKVLLTREKDVFVALRDRAQFATKNNANLFISIHINAATNKSANGFAAYILGPPHPQARPCHPSCSPCSPGLLGFTHLLCPLSDS